MDEEIETKIGLDRLLVLAWEETYILLLITEALLLSLLHLLKKISLDRSEKKIKSDPNQLSEVKLDV